MDDLTRPHSLSPRSKLLPIRHIFMADKAGLSSRARQGRNQSVRKSVIAPGNDVQALALVVMKRYPARPNNVATSGAGKLIRGDQQAYRLRLHPIRN